MIGKFTILHEGKDIDVMFLQDYCAHKELPRHKAKKQFKNGELTLLEIAGRKRLKYLVPVSECHGCLRVISDPDGKFKIVVKHNTTSVSESQQILHQERRKVYSVMMQNQYAFQQGVTKEAILHRLKMNCQEQAIKIKRLSSKYDTVLVIV